jgi:hypothetical protein
MVEARQATDDNIIWRMRIACWITKATDAHSECVILIAFPRQQWIREHTSMLRLYVHCLSCVYFYVTVQIDVHVTCLAFSVVTEAYSK